MIWLNSAESVSNHPVQVYLQRDVHQLYYNLQDLCLQRNLTEYYNAVHATNMMIMFARLVYKLTSDWQFFYPEAKCRIFPDIQS